MASIAPPEKPYDWAADSPATGGDGVLLGAVVALAFAVAALILGYLVIYATFA